MRYEEILRSLAARGVRHVIVGGIAVILHGVPRTTYDLDLLLDLAPENVHAFVSAMEELGYRPRAPVPARDLADPACRDSWVRDQGLRAFTFSHPNGGEVDVLLEAPVTYADASREAVALEASGVGFRIASIETLLRMKIAAGRELDLSDVEALRRVQRLEEDREP